MGWQKREGKRFRLLLGDSGVAVPFIEIGGTGEEEGEEGRREMHQFGSC